MDLESPVRIGARTMNAAANLVSTWRKNVFCSLQFSASLFINIYAFNFPFTKYWSHSNHWRSPLISYWWEASPALHIERKGTIKPWPPQRGNNSSPSLDFVLPEELDWWFSFFFFKYDIFEALLVMGELNVSRDYERYSHSRRDQSLYLSPTVTLSPTCKWNCCFYVLLSWTITSFRPSYLASLVFHEKTTVVTFVCRFKMEKKNTWEMFQSFALCISEFPDISAQKCTYILRSFCTSWTKWNVQKIIMNLQQFTLECKTLLRNK